VSEIVSVDESGFDGKPRPVYGYAQRGHKATAQFRQSSKRHTLLMAVSSHASSDHVFRSLGRVIQQLQTSRMQSFVSHACPFVSHTWPTHPAFIHCDPVMSHFELRG
jgi:hypothetical protein